MNNVAESADAHEYPTDEVSSTLPERSRLPKLKIPPLSWPWELAVKFRGYFAA